MENMVITTGSLLEAALASQHVTWAGALRVQSRPLGDILAFLKALQWLVTGGEGQSSQDAGQASALSLIRMSAIPGLRTSLPALSGPPSASAFLGPLLLSSAQQSGKKSDDP